MPTLQEELTKHFSDILPKERSKPTKNNADVISRILSSSKEEEFPEYTFNFGKYNNYDLEYVAKNNPNYLLWLLTEDFIYSKPRIKDKILKALELVGKKVSV